MLDDCSLSGTGVEWGNLARERKQKRASASSKCITTLKIKKSVSALNPLRPRSNHSQFSLNIISTSSRENVVRINEMITDGKSFDQQTNSLNQFFTEMHGDQSGEFLFGYWGLKGYVPIDRFHMTSRPPYWCPKTIKRRPFWCSKLVCGS